MMSLPLGRGRGLRKERREGRGRRKIADATSPEKKFESDRPNQNRVAGLSSSSSPPMASALTITARAFHVSLRLCRYCHFSPHASRNESCREAEESQSKETRGRVVATAPTAPSRDSLSVPLYAPAAVTAGLFPSLPSTLSPLGGASAALSP